MFFVFFREVGCRGRGREKFLSRFHAQPGA